MEIVSYNFVWMTFNILLALIPVYLAILIARSKNRYAQVLLGILWLLFVPNTIYVLTDLMHLPRQVFRASDAELPILFLQYVLLEFMGVVCFILSVVPVEKTLFHYLKQYKHHSIFFIFCLNFFIAFGVTLGRFQRTNSWEVLTNFQRVIDDVERTLTSAHLLVFIIFFWVTANLIYFLFKDTVKHLLAAVMKKP